MDSLEHRLKSYSAYFTTMVDLIPAKFYLTKDPEMDESVRSSKYWVNKKSKAPKQSVKEATKRARRMKLDPDNHKTNLEQQRESLDSATKTQGEYEGLTDKSSTDSPKKGFSVETVRSTELSDLRERLKTKIDTLRGKRKIAEVEPEQKVLKKQRVMEKRKRKKEARHKKKQQQNTAAAVRATKERPSIKDESGKIVFSKFDFSAATKQTKGGQKDYRRLLAKAEATEKKLEELKRNDKKRGEELEERLQWRKALDLARGEKIKDDSKLIKKTLKRLDKKKSKSQKQWMERAQQDQQQREKRQELRRKHIQERVEKIKAKKSRKKIRKGKRTPGF